MTKQQVEEQCLRDYVIMPDSEESAFKVWWRSLSASTIVNVRFPHTNRGDARRVSNSAKTTVMDDFLAFVDVNSQPNG